MSEPGRALFVQDVRIETNAGSPVVDGVTLEIGRAEILGLVGESGSGKTTTALSVFGYNGRGLKLSAGTITIAGEKETSEDAFRNARGRLASYVPQNPGTSLNPSMRIAQVIEDFVKQNRSNVAADGAQRSYLARVGLPTDEEFGRRYPHQISGGQQQRVCIAASLAPEPALVVLDEPTTGLDVVTQAGILNELLRLRDEEQVAMLYITHDLAVVAQIANRIAVMYAGRIVEQGPTEEILRRPRHPYTRGLIAATPDHLRPQKLETMDGVAVGVGDRLPGCAFAPRCSLRRANCESELPPTAVVGDRHEVSCFAWREPQKAFVPDVASESTNTSGPASDRAILEVEGITAEYRNHRQTTVAASDITFSLDKGGCLALVGESGSGKSTIGRAIVGLHSITSGSVVLDGEELPTLVRKRTVDQRRRIQIVFQNPAEALNPRHSVADSIARPARKLQGLNSSRAAEEVDRLLEAVRLPASLSQCFPGELSGGERQRVAIARALAAAPEILICDEITSALDVSVQAVILNLISDLRKELGVAVIFITHDLGVVANVAERVLVLESGSICERGRTLEVLDSPRDPYTKRLVAAAPSLSAAVAGWDLAAPGS